MIISGRSPVPCTALLSPDGFCMAFSHVDISSTWHQGSRHQSETNGQARRRCDHVRVVNRCVVGTWVVNRHMAPDVTVLSTDVLAQCSVLLTHPVGIATGPAGRRVVVVTAGRGSHRRCSSQQRHAEQSGGNGCFGESGFGDCVVHRVWCVGGVCPEHSHHRVEDPRRTSPGRGIQSHNHPLGGPDPVALRSVPGVEPMVWQESHSKDSSAWKLNFKPKKPKQLKRPKQPKKSDE